MTPGASNATMFGLLNLNKPQGATSRDAVNRVQWLVRQVERPKRRRDASKVGHAGTLDPIATGVLVVCLGPATRLIDYLQGQPKSYRGKFLLGRRSPSDDVELQPEPLADPPIPTAEQIEAALPRFVGEIEQTPPAYSAIKIGGKKAYELARAGAAVEIKPRRVRIDSLTVARYDYPELVLDICCGGGTYVRALGRDLAESLGTAAVMSGLVRTAIGRLTLETAVDPRRLSEESLARTLLPAAAAVADLPRIGLSAVEMEDLRHGRPLPKRDAAGGDLALISPAGELFALGRVGRGGKLWPVRVFG